MTRVRLESHPPVPRMIVFLWQHENTSRGIPMTVWCQTNASVAALTGRGRNTPGFWETGTYTIPSDVADWLRSLAAWWIANPPPVGRGRRSSSQP